MDVRTVDARVLDDAPMVAVHLRAAYVRIREALREIEQRQLERRTTWATEAVGTLVAAQHLITGVGVQLEREGRR